MWHPGRGGPTEGRQGTPSSGQPRGDCHVVGEFYRRSNSVRTDPEDHRTSCSAVRTAHGEHILPAS